MSDSNGENKAKKGGFGAFADKYRDRWAASHPDTKPENEGRNDAPTPETVKPVDGENSPKNP